MVELMINDYLNYAEWQFLELVKCDEYLKCVINIPELKSLFSRELIRISHDGFFKITLRGLWLHALYKF